jgi:hypothetical protein
MAVGSIYYDLLRFVHAWQGSFHSSTGFGCKLARSFALNGLLLTKATGLSYF